VIKLIHSSSLV